GTRCRSSPAVDLVELPSALHCDPPYATSPHRSSTLCAQHLTQTPVRLADRAIALSRPTRENPSVRRLFARGTGLRAGSGGKDGEEAVDEALEGDAGGGVGEVDRGLRAHGGR